MVHGFWLIKENENEFVCLDNTTGFFFCLLNLWLNVEF